MRLMRSVAAGLMCGVLALAMASECLAEEPVRETVTYQGVLNDGGVPANGMYDIKVQYYDELGNAFTTTVTYLEYEVVDGLFSFPIDLINVYSFGDRRFIEFSVRPTGTTEFSVLSPRSEVYASPYSVYALNADVAESAAVADTAVVAETSLDNEWVRSGSSLRVGDTDDKIMINPDLTNGVSLSGASDLQLNFDDANFGGIYLNSVGSGGVPLFGFAVDSSVRGYIGFEPETDKMQFFNLGGSGPSLELSQDSAFMKSVVADGHIVKDYGANDYYRHGPIAYGVVNTDGAVSSGTHNLSSIWNTSANRYELTVSGESINFLQYTTVITPIGSNPVIATTASAGGKLVVFLHNILGADVQGQFNVVIYKNAEVVVD